ncbi:M48 family metallopeptidase [Amycolatopsis sp. NPDC059021]|uniref:M48 family metallopeptidase n=1 Tax=Amycolatopsis sp. NPDC059021 TaxID=3346704 RepID=UPI00366EAC7C
MTDDIEVSRHNAVRFPGISPRAYEHPVDRGALAALRAVPGFAQVVKAVAGFYSERGDRLMALASAIRVGTKQYPEIDRLRHECAETLDLETVPNVFIQRDAQANAMAIGMDEPFIVLTTGLVELMNPESLRFAIGHEMGHVLSGHTVYRTILVRLIQMQLSMSWTPVSALGLRAVIAALHEWFRKAELSCDRAGLLCGQDPTAALRAQILVAGGIDPAKIDIPSFLQQAAEYESVEDIRDSFLKLRNVETLSHPFAVVRAAQLQKWAASEEYRAILAGDYLRRDDDAPASNWTDDLKSAAKSYRDSWSESSDPLVKAFSEVGEAVSGAAGKVWNKFGGGGNGNGGSGSDSGSGSGSAK